MALLPTTLYGYSFYYFDIDRGVMFVNIKVMRPLFCKPVSQFLNSMPPIILLFPLLNTNQFLEQYQSVSELVTKQVNVAMY